MQMPNWWKAMDTLMGVFFLACGCIFTAFGVVGLVDAAVDHDWASLDVIAFLLLTGVASLVIGIRWFRVRRT